MASSHAPEAKVPGKGSFAYLGPYIRRYSRPFLAAILFLSFEAACDLLQPTIMSRVIDEGVAARDLGLVLRLGGLMLLVAALGALAATARNFISSKVSQDFGTSLRADLYRRIMGLSFGSLGRFDIDHVRMPVDFHVYGRAGQTAVHLDYVTLAIDRDFDAPPQ